MDWLVLMIIRILHILFILYVIIVPFMNSNYLLFSHTIFIPFLISHWICNNNVCCLTVAEREIKKRIDPNYTDNDCFTCKLIEPVYDFKNNYNEYSTIIYVITILLWLVSSGKLLYKYKEGKIKRYKDLFVL